MHTCKQIMNYDRVAYLGCKWALEFSKEFSNREIVFNTSNIKDHQTLDVLKNVMNDLADGYSTQWTCSLQGPNIVYSQLIPCDRKRCWLHIFDGEYNNAYAALYDELGELIGDNCLIVWNKHTCTTWNQGYFAGRCPRVLAKQDS
jgi:hypothetical protein